MSSAQVWTVIGALFAVFAAMVALVLAVVRAEIAVLRERVDGIRNELLTRFDALERDLLNCTSASSTGSPSERPFGSLLPETDAGRAGGQAPVTPRYGSLLTEGAAPVRRGQASVTLPACATCGEPIVGVVYHVEPSYVRPLCGDCLVLDRAARQSGSSDRSGYVSAAGMTQGRDDPADDDPVPDSEPCVVCGRPMAFDCWVAPWVNKLCSLACQRERRNARRRVVHQPRLCDGCGESFTPTRSDARFCSNACRQRAYRERHRERAPESPYAAAGPRPDRNVVRLDGEALTA